MLLGMDSLDRARSHAEANYESLPLQWRLDMQKAVAAKIERGSTKPQAYGNTETFSAGRIK
jgi:hypothetical protein